jgi:hypothetical protein
VVSKPIRFYTSVLAIFFTRLQQWQKEIDLISCQVGEITEVKSQVKELRSQMMALTASVNTLASIVSTLMKDKATSSEQGETHRDRYAKFPKERQRYKEEEYHGGYRKKMVADQIIKKSINSLLKEKCCKSNYQEKHVASMEFPRFTALQFRFQEDEKPAQQQKEVIAELELVLVTDQLVESVEDLNHNNVYNSEESNMSKKNPLVVEESKDQPIQEEERIEAKGQQILKAEGISGNLVASLGFVDLKPNDVHNEEFLDLSQERESMKFRKLQFISEKVEIKEGVDISMMKQEFLKKISHINGLYCDANEVFDENLERKLDDGVFFLWCVRWCFDPGKKHSLVVEKK